MNVKSQTPPKNLTNIGRINIVPLNPILHQNDAKNRPKIQLIGKISNKNMTELASDENGSSLTPSLLVKLGLTQKWSKSGSLRPYVLP